MILYNLFKRKLSLRAINLKVISYRLYYSYKLFNKEELIYNPLLYLDLVLMLIRLS